MKKLELVYFRGCPTVPAAKEALNAAHLTFDEIVQDDLAVDDPRCFFSSPSLLLDEKAILGCTAQGDACSVDQWDSPDTAKLLRSLKPDPRA